jgi:hypothetical protein
MVSLKFNFGTVLAHKVHVGLFLGTFLVWVIGAAGYGGAEDIETGNLFNLSQFSLFSTWFASLIIVFAIGRGKFTMWRNLVRTAGWVCQELSGTLTSALLSPVRGAFACHVEAYVHIL